MWLVVQNEKDLRNASKKGRPLPLCPKTALVFIALASPPSMARLVPRAALTSCQSLKAKVRLPPAMVMWACLRWTSFCCESKFPRVHYVFVLLCYRHSPAQFTNICPLLCSFSSCTLIKVLSETSCEAVSSVLSDASFSEAVDLHFSLPFVGLSACVLSWAAIQNKFILLVTIFRLTVSNSLLTAKYVSPTVVFSPTKFTVPTAIHHICQSLWVFN